MHKDEKRKLARTLRKNGKRLKDIAVQLDISFATASLYCNGVLPKGKQAAECTLKAKYLDEVLKKYQSGISIPDISRELGIPATTLYDWRREAGITRNSRKVYVTDDLRSRIGKRLSRDKDGSLKKQAVYLYIVKELSTPEIAEKLGVTSVTIGEWLRREGIELRKSPTLRIRQKLREANLGEKRYNWKGGITPAQLKKRGSLMMRAAREACFERDSYTCQACFKKGGKLNAHHIWPFQRFPDLIYEVSNLITLCKHCHDSFHKAAGGHVKIAIGPFICQYTEKKQNSGGRTRHDN